MLLPVTKPTKTTEISIRYVPLNQVAGWHRNPKQHDIPTLIESLQRFGFTQPLVADAKTGRLVAGHGRLEALIRMHSTGAEPPNRIGVGADGAWTVPVLQGIEFANEQEAEAFLIADNQISALGGWDEAGLDAMLRDLDDLCGVGFDLPEVSASDLHALNHMAALEDEEEEDDAPPDMPRARPSTPGQATPAFQRPPEPAVPVPALAGSTRVGYTLGNVSAPPGAPAYSPSPAGPPAQSSGPASAPAVPWKSATLPHAPTYDIPPPDEEDDDAPVALSSKPNVIVQYNIIFDDVDQRDRFVSLLRDLKAKYPHGETVAERLDLWIQEVRANAAAAVEASLG